MTPSTTTGDACLIYPSLGPYHLARLQRLATLIDFVVIPLSQRELLRQWESRESGGLRVEPLSDQPMEQADHRQLADRLVTSLQALRPRALVVCGYWLAPMRRAMAWARANHCPVILMSDSHVLDKPRRWWKEWPKALWLRHHLDAAFVSGALATKYINDLTGGQIPIWRGYDVVDNDYFALRAAEAGNQTDGGFIYVGRLAGEKNLQRMLEAYVMHRQHTGSAAWPLLIVGDGPQRQALNDHARALGLEGLVEWTGFQQLEALPGLYARSRCLLLPSMSEPWGLVANEAMACGLPALISNRCGCAPDLLFPGINGWILDPQDGESIATAMTRMATLDPERRAEMGEQARKIVAPYSLHNWACALTDCIDHVTGENN